MQIYLFSVTKRYNNTSKCFQLNLFDFSPYTENDESFNQPKYKIQFSIQHKEKTHFTSRKERKSLSNNQYGGRVCVGSEEIIYHFLGQYALLATTRFMYLLQIKRTY